MPHKQYEVSRFLPYDIEDVYSIIRDVESYPEFLPWVSSVTVLERLNTQRWDVELVFSAKGIEKSFISQVLFDDAHHNVKIYGVENIIIRQMNSQWFLHQETGSNMGTHVTYELFVDIKNRLLAKLFFSFFQIITDRILQAFEERLKKLYTPI